MDRRIRFDLHRVFIRGSSAAEPLQQLTVTTHWRRGRFVLGLDFCIRLVILDSISVEFRGWSHSLNGLAAEPIDA